jgi:hypothetical protein
MTVKANKKIILAYFALSISIGFGQPASFTNFTKSVHYVPPANFQLEDYMRDFGLKDRPTDLFKYWGSGVQYDATNEGDTILFMLEPSCYFKPRPGGLEKLGPLFPRTPTDVKEDFDKYFHGYVVCLTNLPPARIGEMAGYTCVSASYQKTGENTTNFFYTCWVQVESNIVVTVTIMSYNKTNFDAATNSLRTLRINKKQIINIVKSSVF